MKRRRGVAGVKRVILDLLHFRSSFFGSVMGS